MKYYILIPLLLFSIISAYSSEDVIRGLVREDSENKNTIAGANVYWLEDMVVTMTDKDGKFKIKRPDNAFFLVASYVGYVSDTIWVPQTQNRVEFSLKASLELDEVTIRARKSGSHLSRIDPIQTIQITGVELDAGLGRMDLHDSA